MELTPSFLALLQSFVPVFTAPTFTTFIQIVTGWVFSQRHLFITEIIFSGGNIANGHWCRFHRFFSHAVWDIDAFALVLAKLVVSSIAPGTTLLWAVDDTLCRRRGLTRYGAGMHYDPLISSRKKTLVSWGHDWVVLCIVIVHPFWAPTKVFALPVATRLYRNHQGLTKGKKGHAKAKKPKTDPNHRTRPELALELIKLAASWFPNDLIIVTGDSAYGGKSVLGHLPENVHLISHVHPKGALYDPAPQPDPNTKTKGRPRKKGARLPGMPAWAEDPNQPWIELKFDQFGLHATLGNDRLKRAHPDRLKRAHLGLEDGRSGQKRQAWVTQLFDSSSSSSTRGIDSSRHSSRKCGSGGRAGRGGPPSSALPGRSAPIR